MNGISPERLLGMRWVLTWKPIEDDQGKDIGHKAKARLIIKGFQDPDLLHIKRDSPTLATSSRNMILAIASTNQWQIEVGDIKTAFLNGDKTEEVRQIFADPPPEVRARLGMKDNEFLRVLEAIYGLLHAPKAWAEKLSQELVKMRRTTSKLEPCVCKLFEEKPTVVWAHRCSCG